MQGEKESARARASARERENERGCVYICVSFWVCASEDGGYWLCVGVYVEANVLCVYSGISHVPYCVHKISVYV